MGEIHVKSGIIIKAALAAAVLLGPMVALADERDADAKDVARGTTAYVRDSVITTKVKARLAAEHLTSIARIHVDTDANGVVYLSGTAQSQDAIDTAIRLARDTEHVRDVRSDLTVHEDTVHEETAHQTD
jgi:hyperosmotically inducible periplasmic protein